MVERFNREEILKRNLLQVEDAKKYRAFFEMFLGHEPDQSELLYWYVEIGLAQIFEVEWREGKNPANLWFTGVEIERPPSDTDGWFHYRRYLDQLVTTEQ